MATAIAPLAVATVVRVVAGKGRFSTVLASLASAWFAINVLIAPYSSRMQRDIAAVRGLFR